MRSQLKSNRTARARRSNAQSRSLLAGKLFDDQGEPLKPSHSNKRGKRYRYYVSMHLVDGRQAGQEGYRMPAKEIEQAVAQALRQDRELQLAWASKGKSDLHHEEVLDHVVKVQINTEHLAIELMMPESDTPRTLSVPFTRRRRGVETRLVLQSGSNREPDIVLAKRIARAMSWVDKIRSGASISEVAQNEKCSPEFISNNLHFGLLSSRILEAVITGKLPPNISTQTIRHMRQLPMQWAEQETLLLT